MPRGKFILKNNSFESWSCFRLFCDGHKNNLRFLENRCFIKISQYSQENMIKFLKRFQRKCFPVNIAKFLRTAFNRVPPMESSVMIEVIIWTGFYMTTASVMKELIP